MQDKIITMRLKGKEGTAMSAYGRAVHRHAKGGNADTRPPAVARAEADRFARNPPCVGDELTALCVGLLKILEPASPLLGLFHE
jgi:hypothetical protein